MKKTNFLLAIIVGIMVIVLYGFTNHKKNNETEQSNNCHYYVEWFWASQSYYLKNENGIWKSVSIPCVSNIISVYTRQGAITNYGAGSGWRRDPERAMIEDKRNELLEIRKQRIERWENVKKRTDLGMINRTSYTNPSLRNRCEP